MMLRTRTRTGTGTQVLTAGQTIPSLQIVSLAGQSGFSRTANVHGFSSSSTATNGGHTRTRTQTRTQTQTRTYTVAAEAPAPGDPGGSKTKTVLENEWPNKMKRRADKMKESKRVKAAERARKKKEKLELNERKKAEMARKKRDKAARRAARRAARKEEGGCFGRRGTAAIRATVPHVAGGGAPGDPSGNETTIGVGIEKLRNEGPQRGVSMQKESGCFGCRRSIKQGDGVKGPGDKPTASRGLPN